MQQIYRDGLAHLDQRSQRAYGVGFAEASSSDQDALLADLGDAPLQSFLGAALANTLEAMYGPPEYGGNRDLVGWSSNGWAGDTQPRGFTRALVTEPDRGGPPAPNALLGIRALPICPGARLLARRGGSGAGVWDGGEQAVGDHRRIWCWWQRGGVGAAQRRPSGADPGKGS